MTFFIQGVFYQKNEGLDIAFKPIEGAVTVIRRALCQYMYAGVIWHNQRNPRELLGDMQDYYGRSRLTDIIISNRQISFTKTYEGRDDYDWIMYVFTKKDSNTWVGTYDGPKCGKGTTRCILTEVSDDFFSPEAICQILGLEKAHEWPPEDA